MNKWFAEYFGTFVLVFAGTGAIVVNGVTGGSITHAGIALTFGLVVLALIYALGEISGCHLNPAVSIGFCVAGRFPMKQLLPYVIAQLAGAITASLLLKAMFPEHETLGSTLPVGPPMRSFLLEMILTLILMVIILCVATGSREQGMMAGVAIGAVIGLEAMFAGPICGASMNPARSIAPAICSGHIEHLWMYCAGPIAGSCIAVVVFRGIKPG